MHPVKSNLQTIDNLCGTEVSANLEALLYFLNIHASCMAQSILYTILNTIITIPIQKKFQTYINESVKQLLKKNKTIT